MWENEDNPDQDLMKATYNGSILLLDLGDGETWNIIITGKERGQIWNFADVGITPCVPGRGFLS